MISSGRAWDAPIEDCTLKHGDQGPYPYATVMDVWVQDPLFGYICEEGRYISCGVKGTDEDRYLRANQGYWLYTFVPNVTLIIPPPMP